MKTEGGDRQKECLGQNLVTDSILVEKVVSSCCCTNKILHRSVIR